MTTSSGGGGGGGDDIQLVTFKVGGQDFAFNIFQVERILRYEAPAPLPKAPEFLEGVLQYQGGAIPLVDLRKRLGTAAPLREDTRTVILEFEGGKMDQRHEAPAQRRQAAHRRELAGNVEHFGGISHLEHTADGQAVRFSLGTHKQIALHQIPILKHGLGTTQP